MRNSYETASKYCSYEHIYNNVSQCINSIFSVCIFIVYHTSYIGVEWRGRKTKLVCKRVEDVKLTVRQRRGFGWPANGKIKEEKIWGWSPGLWRSQPTSCVGLFHTLFFLFGYADDVLGCSCRLLGLIIISPHARSAQTAWHQIFLAVPPYSTSQPSCSSSSLSLWLDWHHIYTRTLTFSSIFDGFPHQGKHHTDRFNRKRFVLTRVSARLFSSTSFTCVFFRSNMRIRVHFNYTGKR